MILTRLITAVLAAPARHLRARRLRATLERAESFRKAGQLSLAEGCYRDALALEPGAAYAHGGLAVLLTGQRRPEEALPHFRAARAAAMLDHRLLEAFVRVLLQRGEHREALGVAQEAARAQPAAYETAFCLGLAHQASHDYAEALACYDTAIESKPDSGDARVNRGIALQNLGMLAEACAEYERALTAQPGHALARFHRSLALLLRGDYAGGWPEYETRLKSNDIPVRPRVYARWDGASPAGSTLLVYGEQGLGDEIMFASCLPDLMRAGARCVVECKPALHRLFARSFGEAVVYAAASDKRVPDEVDALGIDAEVAIGSLPLRYRGSAGDFPRHEGYLRADPKRIAAWRERLAALGSGLKVGISWSGGTHASRAALRSIAPDALLPILQVPGVRFVSLQYTPEAPQDLRTLMDRHGVQVAHWPEAIADYDETAALVSALDLTVSVCTSVVHLAGALGRPVWVMAPKNPEWRYGHAGEAMPWYPSARVFRQERDRDWSGVIAAVRQSLGGLAHAAAGAGEGGALPAAPASAQGHNSEGLARFAARDFRGAQTSFERALELSPGLAEAHSNLAIALLEQGLEERGERHLREAIRLDPQLLSARENLAVSLSARFANDAAVRAWDDVLALDPLHAEAHAGKAFLSMREGLFGEARALLARAVELGADRKSELDWYLGFDLLSKGEFARGWPLYEGRLGGMLETARRPYRFPEWDGSALREGRLLILGEQGLGDEIMFASCYGEAIARAGQPCVIECEPRLARILARSFPQAMVVGHARQGADRELLASRDIARQVHAGSLPGFFRASRGAFPRHAGYLVADAQRVEAWRARLHGAARRRLIGIAWSGGLPQTRRSLRSIPAKEFAALLRIPGVEFVSLQHDDDGSMAKELAALAGACVHAFPSALADLDDTAALMKSLDCVLTVCSTVVHLAGALGVPALVLTPQRAEWRYLLEGESLPWYPSVRLVRQQQSGDWTGAVHEARALLTGADTFVPAAAHT